MNNNLKISEKLELVEKILSIIQNLNDKYCYEHAKSITEFNPADNNISFGKMLACTEIRESILSYFLKEVKTNV